jgi:hypothetical protein
MDVFRVAQKRNINSADYQADVLKNIDVHDHIAVLYYSYEEKIISAASLLSIGLERNELCIYVTSGSCEKDFFNALDSLGVDIDSAVKSGSITVNDNQEIYLSNGQFDPNWMLDSVAASAEEASAGGYSGLRAVGDMTWALNSISANGKLIDYEDRLNRIFPNIRATGFCQYDLRLFPPDVIRKIIRTHPYVLYRGTLCKNSFYIPPEEWRRKVPEWCEISRQLESIYNQELARREHPRNI